MKRTSKMLSAFYLPREKNMIPKKSGGEYDF